MAVETGTKKQRVVRYAEQLKETVRRKHPEAQFRLAPGEERNTWDLLTYTNAETASEILDLTIGLVSDIVVDEPFAVYVIPMPLSAYGDDGQSERAA